MPRILHVMAGSSHGGAETYFANMVGALQKGGLEQRAIIRKNEERAALLNSYAVPVKEVPFDNLFDKSTRGVITQEIKEFKPDIVQTWMYEATRATPSGDYLHVGWLRGTQHLRDYRRCDYLIGMTKGIVTSVVQQRWPDDRIQHIRPFADDTTKPAISRATYNTPDDAPLLLAMGRLHWHKAFDTLILSLRMLPDAYLWLAGEGDLREELEQFARDLGVSDRVRFLGWQEDQRPLFAAADICVVPSRYEPFGLVVIEAWAQKKPLIVTQAAGPRATVQNNVDALLIPIDDVDALTAAIRRLINDKKLGENLVRSGYAHYERDYTKDSAVAQYIQYYQEILQRGIQANRKVSKLAELQDRILNMCRLNF